MQRQDTIISSDLLMCAGTTLRSRCSSLLPFIVIILTIGIVYYRSLDIEMLGYDQLTHLDFVREAGPFAGFRPDAAKLYTACECVYRPFFILQMGLLYQLFGLNHTGYQIVLLIIHAIGCCVLYIAFQHLTQQRWLPLIFILFFATHPVLFEHVIWVSDTNLWLNLLAGLTLLLLLKPRLHWLWVAALALVVGLAPFLRENGLALPAGVVAFALIGYLTRHLSRRQAITLVLIALAAITFYFTMRARTVGLLPGGLAQVDTDLALFTRHYTLEEVAAFSPIQRRVAYLYNVGAYLTAAFFPIFNFSGVIIIGQIALTLGVIVAAMLALWVFPRWQTLTPRTRILSALGLLIVVLLGTTLISAFVLREPLSIRHLIPLADYSRYAIHGLLSVIVIGALWASRRHLSPAEYALAALALILILTSSSVAFIYFRYRNLNLALVGWLILLALALAHAPARWHAPRLAPILLVIAFLFNSILHFRQLPPSGWIVENFERSSLCHEAISEDLALAVADEYHLDHEAVLACRAQFLRDNRQP